MKVNLEEALGRSDASLKPGCNCIRASTKAGGSRFGDLVELRNGRMRGTEFVRWACRKRRTPFLPRLSQVNQEAFDFLGTISYLNHAR